MARLHTTDKILKYANKINISGKTLELLVRLLKDANGAAIIEYKAMESLYVIELFSGSYDNYYLSFIQLKEQELLQYDSHNDTLIVTVLYEHHLNNLIYSLKRVKRKYTREPGKQQHKLVDILSSGSLGKIVTTALIKAAHMDPVITYNLKESGFKIPESLFPYFTGEPMPDEQRRILTKYNQLERIIMEEQKRDLSKEPKRAYCACLSFCNDEGIIEDYNEHSLLQSLYKQFGKQSFVQYTWYLAMNKLKELKLVEEFYDPEKDCNCLRVVGYKPAFTQGDRYVFIPYVIFSSKFKKLESAGMKVFFDLMFKLNNGEAIDKYGNVQHSGQNKATFLKIAKMDVEKEESKIKFSKTLSWLKKRYPNEIRTALFGDAAKNCFETKKIVEYAGDEASGIDLLKQNLSINEFNALAEYFHFNYVSGTALIVRVREEYYISKKAEMLKQQLSLQGRYKRKVQLIEGILADRGIKYNTDDMVSFIKIFKRANKKSVSLVLNLLADRIQKSGEEGWDFVRSLGAYTQTLYQKYRSGSLEQILS